MIFPPRSYLRAAGLLLGLLSAAGVVIGRSESTLRWESDDVRVSANSWDDRVSLKFPFQNTGTRPVWIVSVASHCVCTEATLAKPTYAPGEKGTIDVVFTIGDLVGHQERSLTVFSDDSPNEPKELTLEIDIAEVIHVSPRFLFWEAGGSGEAKVVAIHLADAKGVRLEANCDNPLFSLHTERGPGDSADFHVSVQPANVARPASGVVHVTLTDGKRVKTIGVLAAVKERLKD